MDDYASRAEAAQAKAKEKVLATTRKLWVQSAVHNNRTDVVRLHRDSVQPVSTQLEDSGAARRHKSPASHAEVSKRSRKSQG